MKFLIDDHFEDFQELKAFLVIVITFWLHEIC